MKKLILIGVAVLGLAAMLTPTQAQAQERYRTLVLTNTVFPTLYAPQGGTNSVTVTNAQATYAPSTAKVFSVRDLQNGPVWWDLAVKTANTGTSNTVVGVDLAVDDAGTYWISNAVTATIAATGTGTNVAHVYFPLSNSTNVFSGYRLGRWSYTSTAQLTNVTLLQNQIISFR